MGRTMSDDRTLKLTGLPEEAPAEPKTAPEPEEPPRALPSLAEHLKQCIFCARCHRPAQMELLAHLSWFWTGREFLCEGCAAETGAVKDAQTAVKHHHNKCVSGVGGP